MHRNCIFTFQAIFSKRHFHLRPHPHRVSRKGFSVEFWTFSMVFSNIAFSYLASIHCWEVSSLDVSGKPHISGKNSKMCICVYEAPRDLIIPLCIAKLHIHICREKPKHTDVCTKPWAVSISPSNTRALQVPLYPEEKM